MLFLFFFASALDGFLSALLELLSKDTFCFDQLRWQTLQKQLFFFVGKNECQVSCQAPCPLNALQEALLSSRQPFVLYQWHQKRNGSFTKRSFMQLRSKTFSNMASFCAFQLSLAVVSFLTSSSAATFSQICCFSQVNTCIECMYRKTAKTMCSNLEIGSCTDENTAEQYLSIFTLHQIKKTCTIFAAFGCSNPTTAVFFFFPTPKIFNSSLRVEGFRNAWHQCKYGACTL